MDSFVHAWEQIGRLSAAIMRVASQVGLALVPVVRCFIAAVGFAANVLREATRLVSWLSGKLSVACEQWAKAPVQYVRPVVTRSRKTQDSPASTAPRRSPEPAVTQTHRRPVNVGGHSTATQVAPYPMYATIALPQSPPTVRSQFAPGLPTPVLPSPPATPPTQAFTITPVQQPVAPKALGLPHASQPASPTTPFILQLNGPPVVEPVPTRSPEEVPPSDTPISPFTSPRRPRRARFTSPPRTQRTLAASPSTSSLLSSSDTEFSPRLFYTPAAFPDPNESPTVAIPSQATSPWERPLARRRSSHSARTSVNPK